VDIQAYIQSGIVETYVLGVASAEEVAEIEKLRLTYPEVDKAIDEFSESLETEAFANAIAPPPEVKTKIMAAISHEKDSSIKTIALPLKDEDTNVSAPVRSLRVWRFAAAASVVLFLISAALNYYLYNRYSSQNSAYQALLTERNSLQANNQIYQTQLHQWQSAAQMMADPTMAMIKMPGAPGKENNMATLFWDTKTKDVYVMPNKLPKVEGGKQYQLWALVDGKPVDAGILDPTCNSVCKMKNIPKAQAFAITLENEGGSATPTMNAMYVMGKV
jgi:anti-sigma-K factor RskA